LVTRVEFIGEQAGDEKSAQHEEQIDTEIATGQAGHVAMIGDD
jgi:hypothetical protein